VPLGWRPPWIHEIKHDGFRLMVRRDAAGVLSPAKHPANVLVTKMVTNG